MITYTSTKKIKIKNAPIGLLQNEHGTILIKTKYTNDADNSIIYYVETGGHWSGDLNQEVTPIIIVSCGN